MTTNQPKTGMIDPGTGVAINILIKSTNPFINNLMGLKKYMNTALFVLFPLIEDAASPAICVATEF